jgi:hypothetical protein
MSTPWLWDQPAASINGGFSRGGLPIGLQIIGRRFDDHGVLQVAYAYEAAANPVVGTRVPNGCSFVGRTTFPVVISAEAGPPRVGR